MSIHTQEKELEIAKLDKKWARPFPFREMYQTKPLLEPTQPSTSTAVSTGFWKDRKTLIAYVSSEPIYYKIHLIFIILATHFALKKCVYNFYNNQQKFWFLFSILRGEHIFYPNTSNMSHWITVTTSAVPSQRQNCQTLKKVDLAHVDNIEACHSARLVDLLPSVLCHTNCCLSWRPLNFHSQDTNWAGNLPCKVEGEITSPAEKLFSGDNHFKVTPKQRKGGLTKILNQNMLNWFKKKKKNTCSHRHPGSQ